MKKVFLPIALLVLTVSTLTSCKKDYTCACTEPSGLTDIDYPLNDMKEDDAEAACDGFNATFAIVGGSCTLSEN